MNEIKSNNESWSGFNLGRPLFHTATCLEYDRIMARYLMELIKGRDICVEYGCGDGIFLEFLATNHPLKTFIGIEWNKMNYGHAVNVRGPGLRNLSFANQDMSTDEGIFLCNCFYSLGGLEHFSDSVGVLKKWVAKLTPGGECLLTIPNLLNRAHVEQRFKLKPEQYLGQDRMVTDDYGYSEVWSPNHFARVVMDAGLEILELNILDQPEFELPLLIRALKREDKP